MDDAANSMPDRPAMSGFQKKIIKLSKDCEEITYLECLLVIERHEPGYYDRQGKQVEQSTSGAEALCWPQHRPSFVCAYLDADHFPCFLGDRSKSLIRKYSRISSRNLSIKSTTFQ